MRDRILVLGVIVGIAASVAGCASARVVPHASGSASDTIGYPVSTPCAADVAPMTAAPLPVVACPPPPCYVATPCDPPCSLPCGLPCERGEDPWRVRAFVGLSFMAGTDTSGDQCCYSGIDIGRTLPCSCWSVGAFWRMENARLDRDPNGHDDGTWNHVGVAVGFEKSLGGGRWFAWGAVGPEYFWTDGYLHDDDGFGAFGEVGIGYRINRHWRVLAGVDLHCVYTDAARQSPADDGNSRWLLTVAPVIGVEFDF